MAILSFFFLVSLSSVFFAVKAQRPSTFRVSSVPYYRQYTDYACGCAASQMVFDFYGAGVDQRALIDIMRTNSGNGTLAVDIVRGAHFSSLSAPPPGVAPFVFPNQLPSNGYENRALGMAAFIQRSENCWIDELLDIVASNTPIIVLTYYDLNPNSGGHYRVVVGYSDETKEVLMHDPWDRDGQPRLYGVSYTQFCTLWSRAEPQFGLPPADPYTAIFALPLDVDVTVELNSDGNVTISANVSYPCPMPFCYGAAASVPYPISNLVLNLTQVPASLTLLPDTDPVVKVPSLLAGSSYVASWRATPSDQDPSAGAGKIENAIVIAYGEVSGDSPARWGYNMTDPFPAYSYSDLIGGVGSAEY